MHRHVNIVTSYGTLVHFLRVLVQSYEFRCISPIFPSCYLDTWLILPDPNLKSQPTILIAPHTETKRWAGLQPAHLYTQAPRGVWWMLMEAKGFVVCVLSLDSHKKKNPLPFAYRPWAPGYPGQREDIKAGSYRKRDEDCDMGRFYVLFPKMLYLM